MTDGFEAEEPRKVGNEQTAFGSRDGAGLGQFAVGQDLQPVERAVRHGNGCQQGSDRDQESVHWRRSRHSSPGSHTVH